MKNFMTIMGIILFFNTAGAEVFKGELGICGRTLSDEQKKSLIKQTTELAVATCVGSNFLANDCLAALPVTTETYGDISLGGSMCRGPIVTTLIQVGKPACE